METSKKQSVCNELNVAISFLDKNETVETLLPNERNFIIAMIGGNGTGKTSVAKEIVLKWKADRPEKKCMAFDVFDNISAVTDSKINLNDDLSETIGDKVKDSLIVFDDYKLFADNNRNIQYIKDLMIIHRSQNNDYIYSCHSPSDLLPQIFPFTTHVYVFYTNITNGRLNDRLPNSDLINSAIDYVNLYVKLHGKGKHQSDSSYDGQGFPYCIVNTIDGTITGVNMGKRVVIN